MPPQMLFVSLAYLVGILVYVVRRLRRAREQARRLRQAQAGERAVAEYVETLREERVRALHDLVGEGLQRRPRGGGAAGSVRARD